jgi:hypothetical protein
MTTLIAPSTPGQNTDAVIERLRSAGLSLPRQLPRILWVPDLELDFSLGHEAVELCKRAGLDLDDWQEFALILSLARKPDGHLVAEVGIDIARQNGKGAILEGRGLAGLFLLDELELIHTAHQFKTALSAFWRIRRLVEGTPDLLERVKPRGFKLSHGEEGIYLDSGQQILFATRTKGNARGLSANWVALDEAMYLTDDEIAALMPTLSAKSMEGNPQIWYTGSAVDQVTQAGVVFARIRNRGIAGGDDDLVYIEYSAEGEIEDAEFIADDPAAWQAANPGLGIRISPDWIAKERKSMDLRTFAVERLGIGDWPDPDELDALTIDLAVWATLADDTPPLAPLALAIDTKPDRSMTSIAAAGYGDDKLPRVRILDRQPGTGWVVTRTIELIAEMEADGVAIDTQSPAASLIPQFENEGVKVHPISATEHARACGMFFDLVDQAAMRHSGDPVLTSAIKGSAQRPLAGAWAWSRKHAATDISPLVAATLALWKARTQAPKRKPTFEVIV